jgi:hypothetical protein
MANRTRSRAALALCAALALPACRTTPEEIQRIEAENELLREQIQAMRSDCEQSRDVRVDVEKTGETPRPPAPPEPAPPPP